MQSGVLLTGDQFPESKQKICPWKLKPIGCMSNFSLHMTITTGLLFTVSYTRAPFIGGSSWGQLTSESMNTNTCWICLLVGISFQKKEPNTGILTLLQ